MKEIEEALKENDLDKVEELCNALLEENEFDIQGLFYQSILLRKKQNFTKALESHDSLINLIPNNPDYYAERGLTYHMLKEKDLALNDFDRAVELNSNNGYRYSSRAFVRDYYGDHAGAIEDYNKAIELDPDDAISLNNRGVIEEKLGRLNAAKESFDKSDQISGIEQNLKAMATSSKSAKPSSETKVEDQKLNASGFLATLKAIFISKEERKSFFDFLFPKK